MDKIYQEIKQYLITVEAIQSNVIDSTEQWNEVYAPAFRNYKIFVSGDGSELMIVIPSHTTSTGEYAYHLIRESLTYDSPNGTYALMSADKMQELYKFKFLKHDGEKMERHSINDLAGFLLDNMAEIKKMKTRAKANRASSAVQLAIMLKEFFNLP